MRTQVGLDTTIGTFVSVVPDTSAGQTEGIRAQLMTNASSEQDIYVGLKVRSVVVVGVVVVVVVVIGR